jgi:tRNA-dihydrouridine synthase B
MKYDKDFWKNIKKPIISLAPMEGYTDSSFRRVCKKVNPEVIVFTEFTSADGLHYNSYTTKKKFKYFPEEQPLIAQIFGKRIDGFITAAKFCEDHGFAGVDINMGCPAKKVFRAEHGVALRANKEHAYRLIEAVANHTSLPVSVKTRLGLEDHSDLIEFSKRAENAGCNMITIHGRTYKEMYRGEGNWDPIYELKDNINIPVIGNGGIHTLEQGYEMLKNLDGFMIGRASFGNPWVFNKIEEKPKTFAEKMKIIKLHAQYLIEAKGEYVATREIRNHLISYVRDMPGAKQYRIVLTQVESYEEIVKILEDIVEDQKTRYGR